MFDTNKQMWSRKTGWTDAKHCLESYGLEPIKLGAKEGNKYNINNHSKNKSLTVDSLGWTEITLSGR